MSRVICIIHSEDTLPWATFIKNLFPKQRSSRYEVRSVFAKDLVQCNPSSARLDVEDAEFLVVILSPDHLHFLGDHPDFTYHGLAKGGQKGVLLFCGTSTSDIKCNDPDGSDLRTRFPSYKDWKALEHSDINDLPNILESIQPLSSLVYQLIPDRVQCEHNSTVTVSFSEVIAATPTELQMALYISNDDDGASEENVEVTWMNDKTVFFAAPERREGSVNVRVVVNGNQIAGTNSLKYESSCELVSDMMQLYIYAVDHLISLVLSKSLISNDELDTFLFKIFSEDEPRGIQPKAFEELFGIYRFHPNVKSQAELPTLLHFANKFGFEKFNSWLENLPDAELASKILSCDSLQAEKVNKFKIEAAVPPAVPDPLFIKCQPVLTGPSLDDDSPEEDYLDMETTTRIRNEIKKKLSSASSGCRPDAPVMKICADEYKMNEGSFDDTYTTFGEEEDKELYEPIDKSCDFQTETIVEEEDSFPPQATNSQGISPALCNRPAVQSGAAMDPGQQKLIEIMTQVKCGELTMEEANILFNEWKIQHTQKSSRTNLLSRSKQSLYEMTAPLKHPAIPKDVKAIPTFPDPVPSRTVWRRGSDLSDKHSSTASSNSFDSSRSSTASSAISRSSGIDADLLDEDPSSRRNSGGSTDSGVAPPLPARDIRPNPSKNATLPRMLPGFSKPEGPSGKNDKDKPSRSLARR